MTTSNTCLKQGEKRIENATVKDLLAALESARITGVELGREQERTVLNGSVIGDSAGIVMFGDNRRQKAYAVRGKLTRDDVQAILQRYIEHGDRHPEYEWFVAEGVPWVRTVDWGPLGKSGCLTVLAVLILLGVLAVWFWLR